MCLTGRVRRMPHRHFNIENESLRGFCHRHGVARLSLFGSVLRADFGPASDIDVLVEFLPGRTPGLFAFAGMQIELEELMGGGRVVDLRTPNDLSRYFRGEVMRTAELQYAA